MLKPVPIPTSPNDKPAWERMRAFFIASEMEGDGKIKYTPAQAALQADARTLNVFRGAFPGQALPLASSAPSRESGLPGGMRTADGRTWVIASRPEDDRSAFPKEERIQPEMLRAMAESYNPEQIHRAPVVLPDGGPAHWTGEFSREMAGDVDGLEFDGYHLWALVNERDGRVTEAVSDGLGNRSIRWWPSFPAAGGQPYLRHLAVMAEPAGTENLGLLDHFFSTEQKGKGRSQSEIDDWQALAVCDRNLGEIPTIDADSLQAAKETVMAKEPENLDIEKIVAATVTRVLAEQKPVETPKTPTDMGEQIRAAVTAANAPLLERVAAAEKAATEAAAKLAEAGQESRKVEITRACDQLVREGKITPPMRAILEPSLVALPEDQLRSRFEELAKLPVAGPSTRALAIIDDSGAEQPIPAHLTAPPETGLSVANPEDLRIERTARELAEKESDPSKQRAVYEREILKGYGQAPASAPSFLN